MAHGASGETETRRSVDKSVSSGCMAKAGNKVQQTRSTLQVSSCRLAARMVVYKATTTDIWVAVKKLALPSLFETMGKMMKEDSELPLSLAKFDHVKPSMGPEVSVGDLECSRPTFYNSTQNIKIK